MAKNTDGIARGMSSRLSSFVHRFVHMLTDHCRTDHFNPTGQLPLIYGNGLALFSTWNHMEPYGRGIPVFLIYQSGNQSSSSSVGSAGGATPTIHHPPVSHWFRMPSFRWGQVECSDGGDDVDDDGGDDEEEGDDKAGSKN